MTIIPSLLVLVLGVAATGMVGGAWVNYGEVTPATMLYLAQDMTQTPLPAEPTRTAETVPATGTIAPIEQAVPIAPAPPERPIMSPPPDHPGARDFSGQQPPSIKPMPPEGQEFNNDEEQQELQIDPREIRQTLRDITQMQRELKRFLSTLKKSKADTSEVGQLLEKINQYRTAISGSDMEAVRDAVHEFRDENYWETIQMIRAKVELPKQLAQMKKELTKLEKTIKAAVYQKMGVNVGSIIAYISDSRARISQMESLLNAGDFDELNSLMQENQETPMPGELMEALSRLKEVDSRMKKVKDAGAKTKIQEILNEVIQLMNGGEYREARDLMNQNTQQIQQVIYPSSNNKNNGKKMAPGTR